MLTDIEYDFPKHNNSIWVSVVEEIHHLIDWYGIYSASLIIQQIRIEFQMNSVLWRHMVTDVPRPGMDGMDGLVGESIRERLC